ncbi:Transposase IS4 [Popillia japonica]|uniref:Transposase IS4 n=1 Tax=Popillia japonica TaxID=7064 RepID=A0AAW1KCH4_POPJA
MIAQYNKYMGGVDLHDNGVSNYRINVRGKKWWWPLFINLLDSTSVNAWKIYNIANETQMTQLELKSYIVVRLMKTEDDNPNRKINQAVGSSIPEVRLANIGHVISMDADKAGHRCKLRKSHTIYIWVKCKTHLHLKCFEAYHKKI